MLFIKLKWFFKIELKRYLGATFLLIFIALLQLIPPQAVRIIVDNISLHRFNKSLLLFWIFIMIITALVTYFLRFIWRILLFGASYKLAINLRESLYNFFSNQHLKFYLKHRTGDIIARVTNDVDRVVFAAGEGVLTLIDSIIIGCSVLIVMSFQISYKLTCLSLIPMPIMAFLVKKDGHNLHKRFYVSQKAFSNMNNKVQDNLTNIRMIKSFGIEKYKLFKFNKITNQVNEKNMEVAKVDSRFDPVIYLTIGISNFIAIFFGSMMVVSKIITIGQLTSFIMYLSLMIWPMLAIAWMFNILERGNAAYNRIQQILEYKEKTKYKNILLLNKVKKLCVNIKMFKYPNSKKKILKNIKFKVYPGKILGICGPTGSGKSTLLSIIMRDLDVKYGDIKYNNISIKKIKRDIWYKKISIVHQNPFLFSDTIKNNITMIDDSIKMEKIEKISKISCIHKDIIKFNKGYEFKIEERGLNLSGGQKQRISIARTLLSNKDLIIMDDAFSAIDICTEDKLIKNLNILKIKKIIIFVSHRLSTIKNFYEIIVIKDGSIIQRGNHSSLIKENGWYKNMYNFQKLEKNL